MSNNYDKTRLRLHFTTIAFVLAFITMATGCTVPLPQGDDNLTWEVEEGEHLKIYASGTLSKSWGDSFKWDGDEYRTTCVIGDALSGISDEVFRRHLSDHIRIEAENCFQIGNQCFQGTSAKWIDLSQTTVETLGYYSFANTKNLSSVHLPGTLKTIDEGAFSESSIQTIYFYGTRQAWEEVNAMTGNDLLNEIEIVCVADEMTFDDYSGNAYWRLTDNTLEIIANGAYVGGSGSMNYSWRYRNDVHDAAKRIVIEGSITYLSPYAFSERVLDEAMISSSTFVECGMGLFAQCQIERVDLAQTSLTELPMDMFYGSEITQLILPSTIERIGSCAFQDSRIKTIFFVGTQEEWGNIIIENSNDPLYDTQIIFITNDKNGGIYHG